MKNIFSSKHILAAALVATAVAGCRKNNEYRSMEPTQEVKMSTYDFLKQANNSGLYDTLLYLLDKSGVAEKLKNGKTTFFAPQDYNIASAMENLNFMRKKRGDQPNWTVDSVRTGVWDTLLSRYLVNGQYTLDSLRLGDGVNLVTPYGYEMSARALTTAASGISAGGPMKIQFSDKNNSRLTKFWVSATTQSTNVTTTTGVVHMLEPNHIFGFAAFLPQAYPAQQEPYFDVPFMIPGTGSVDIAYYDRGGEGIAYHDFEPANRGNGKFRFEEGVDTDVCTEGPYNIGYTYPDEWLKYTIKVEHTGLYRTYSRVATPNANCIIHMEVDDEDATGLIYLNKGTGYQNWVTVQGKDVHLTAGEHVVKYVVDAAGLNMARFGFVPKFRKPFNGEPLKIPGTLPIAEFDWGGEGIGYKDADAQNRGNAKHYMRAFEGPDVETNAAEGGFNVGYIAVGEWLSYSVNVAKAGKYDITFRVAVPSAGKIRGEMGSTNITGSLTLPKTGAYGTYTSVVKKDVTLAAGENIFKVVVESGAFNIANITFVAK